MESDKSDFADSFYGLTSFRIVLIRNYIFLILVNVFLFWKISTAIFTHPKGARRKVEQPFSAIQRARGDRAW